VPIHQLGLVWVHGCGVEMEPGAASEAADLLDGGHQGGALHEAALEGALPLLLVEGRRPREALEGAVELELLDAELVVHPSHSLPHLLIGQPELRQEAVVPPQDLRAALADRVRVPFNVAADFVARVADVVGPGLPRADAPPPHGPTIAGASLVEALEVPDWHLTLSAHLARESVRPLILVASGGVV